MGFKKQASGVNLKLLESQRKIEMIIKDKDELNLSLEQHKKKYEQDIIDNENKYKQLSIQKDYQHKQEIAEKDNEINLLKSNHQILENSKNVSGEKVSELQGICLYN